MTVLSNKGLNLLDVYEQGTFYIDTVAAPIHAATGALFETTSARMEHQLEHRAILLTNFRPAPSTSTQSQVSIHDWRIIQLAERQVLVGFLENGLTCRVTTNIASIEFVAREVQTSSGRLYQLLGPPACEPERLAVIAVRVALSARPPYLDVTDGVWTAMCKVTA